MRDLDAGRLLIPDPIAVTLTRPPAYQDAGASAVVRYVQEQSATEQEVESPMGGSLEGTRRRFRMWLVECGSLVPHKGCLVTKADGSVWEVASVDVLSHGRQFRCHCTRRPS